MIVLSTDDETRAFSDEVRLIAEHHTFIGDPRYNGVGCNYTLGGDGASGCSPSMKTRKKLSEKASVFMLGNKNGLGKTKTPEERLHISSSLQGHIVSETTRLKISQRLIGRKLSVEHVIRSAEGHRGGGKPVEQMNGNVVVALFASAKLAQDATGVNRSKICDCCKNKRARAGGYGWRYAN